ncbi:MAG: hypothetical protein HKN96_04050 [Flavobacteriaceae bacterium]|nr:hypothetical protein [Flavobacteriaceae bacterium]NNK27034.1 hypothetical protein [Flavobacteriaceae bacterium]
MRRHANLLFVIAVFFTCVVIGQECDTYLLLKEGTSLEYTNYDRKGKAITIGTHKAAKVTSSNGKFESNITLDVKDLKKGDTFTMEYDVSCEDGVLSIDMSRFFDSSQLMQYEGADFDIDIQGDMLYFPRDLVEGADLNDGNITIKVAKDGFTFVTMTMTIFNRKVLGKESITTDAGTFECQKVTFDFESKFGIIKVRGSAIEWYHDNRIIVKSESYNKKGKLLGSTKLTAMTE